MKNYMLSIVIPVYNVGYDNLHKCLKSIEPLLYTYLNKIRVILVNDCSPKWDEEVRSIPYSVKVLWHSVNKGLSEARNTGLKYVIESSIKSKWIWFIDSDDYLPNFNLEEFHWILTNSIADLIQFGANYDTGKEIKPAYFNMYAGSEYTKPIDTLARNYKFVPCVWSKIYSVEFLHKNNLWNNPGFYFEDHEFLIRCLIKANRVQSSPLVIYNYNCTNPNSIMNEKWGVKKVYDLYRVVRICRKLLSKFPKDKIDKRLTEYKNNEIVWKDKFELLSVKYKMKVILKCTYWALTKGYIKYILPDR